MPLGAANPSTREYTVPLGSKLKMPDDRLASRVCPPVAQRPTGGNQGLANNQPLAVKADFCRQTVTRKLNTVRRRQRADGLLLCAFPPI